MLAAGDPRARAGIHHLGEIHCVGNRAGRPAPRAREGDRRRDRGLGQGRASAIVDGSCGSPDSGRRTTRCVASPARSIRPDRSTSWAIYPTSQPSCAAHRSCWRRRRDEAFGLTVVEAMACGAAGGGRGWRWPPRDRGSGSSRPAVPAGRRCGRIGVSPAGWRTRPTMQTEVGRALRVRFEAEYRIERHAERLEAVYRDLLDGRRRRRPARPAPAARTAGRAGRSPWSSRAATATAGSSASCASWPDALRRPRRDLRRRSLRSRRDGRRRTSAGRWSTTAQGCPAPSRSVAPGPSVLAREGFDVTVGFGVECPPGDIAVVGSVHRAWLGQSGPVEHPVRRRACSRDPLRHASARCTARTRAQLLRELVGRAPCWPHRARPPPR